MDRLNAQTSMRLLAAAAGSLILLASLAVRLQDAVGRGPFVLIISGLCVGILVPLVPVVFRAPWTGRLLALSLAVFPTMMLLSTLLFSKAFIR